MVGGFYPHGRVCYIISVRQLFLGVPKYILKFIFN